MQVVEEMEVKVDVPALAMEEVCWIILHFFLSPIFKLLCNLGKGTWNLEW
jgi:hypothetical protein